MKISFQIRFMSILLCVHVFLSNIIIIDTFQPIGIWSPKNQTPTSSLSDLNKSTPPTPPPPPLQPVWTPQPSPQSNRKEFRPVRFESPTLPRKYVLLTSTEPALPPWNDSQDTKSTNFISSNQNHQIGSSSSIAADFPKSSISEKIKSILIFQYFLCAETVFIQTCLLSFPFNCVLSIRKICFCFRFI